MKVEMEAASGASEKQQLQSKGRKAGVRFDNERLSYLQKMMATLERAKCLFSINLEMNWKNLCQTPSYTHSPQQDSKKQWRKQESHRKDMAKYLLSGGARLTPTLGLTKTETEEMGSKEKREKEEKAKKQTKCGRNKKKRHHQKDGKVAPSTTEKRRFYIAGKNHKLNQCRKKRRNYKALMNSLVSGMRKKEEYKWLRKLPDMEGKVVLRNPIINRKVKIAANKKDKTNADIWKKNRDNG
jgi:hypothetical protein